MTIPSTDIAGGDFAIDDEAGVELETLALNSPQPLEKSEKEHARHRHSHNHDHDHHHGHDYGHDHHHENGHGHAHRHDCSSCDHGKGWKMYLPHAHGLEHRLAADRSSLIRAGIILSVAVLGQLIAGFVGNSSVLVVEAVHSMLDGLNVLLALLSVHLAARKPTPRVSYGYARAEVLSALVSVLGLGLLCFKLTAGAVERLWHYFRGTRAKIHVEGKVVFIAEAVTLLSNVAMTFVLSRNQSSLNIRALRAHIIADCIENVIVLFAGVLMWAVPKASIIDPILTLCIVCLLVVLNAKIGWEAVYILMQAAPDSADVEGAAAELRGVPGVEALGPLHVWTLTSGTIVATSVAKLEKTLLNSRKDVREAFNRILKAYGATVTMVELNGAEEDDLETGFTEKEEDDIKLHYNPLAEED
eukprot:Plantae.Rhodophyta-Hildenbrandia_rubra.ctg9648.p1 GENE.Plantae.Rhodophyta-Hildenbrandia_rubra.ctg9648~~Plantae.Rhodophyta-Hildenbrandia_rubra.ctg9648.p1  ORF type:complete len:415 (-),score=66.70 Plantae.Rhodophyta-Hildenbrandia_rubra.ctg9648:1130-2374(-)